MQATLGTNTHTIGQRRIIHLRGPATDIDIKPLMSALRADAERTSYILNMKRVSHVTAEFMHAVTKCGENLALAGCTLTLSEVPPEVLAVMHVIRATSQFALHNDHTALWCGTRAVFHTGRTPSAHPETRRMKGLVQWALGMVSLPCKYFEMLRTRRVLN